MAMANVTVIVFFMCVTAFCTVLCIIATLLCYMDYMKQKRASREEIAHLKTEVRACRELLKRRAKSDV